MRVGIFTIVKNEHDYLDEWLQYHLNTFPELTQIYVFDDPFSKSHKDICTKYKKVTSLNSLSIFPQNRQKDILNRKDYKNTELPRQVSYMYEILNYLKKNTNLDWVFYIDVDEFLTYQEGVKNSLDGILRHFCFYDILVLSWKNFGANGHIYKPNGKTLEIYTTSCSLAVGSRMDINGASKECFNLHRWNPNTIKANHHIPTKAVWCKTNFSKKMSDVVYDKIYIRHYITRSFEEFCYKIFIRGQFYGSKCLNNFFHFNKDIEKNNPEVQKILNSYKERFFSGELNFSLY